MANAIEALFRGALSSTDNPEMRLRWNVRTGVYSCRIYAKNRTKTGHGTGATVAEAVEAAVEDRMRGPKAKA